MRYFVTKLLLGLVLNLYWLPITQADFSNDTQFWWKTQIKEWDGDKIDINAEAEVRFNEGVTNLFNWRLAQKLIYSPHKNIDLGIGYRFEKSGKGNNDPLKRQHRLELEVNPHFKLFNGINIKTRNRLEFRWKEDRGGELFPRYRHRVLISTRANWLPGLEKVEMGNEFFYDFDADKYNQNRLYPLRAKFKMTPKVSITLFYMLLSRRDATSGGWRHAHVIGASFQLNPFKKVSPR